MGFFAAIMLLSSIILICFLNHALFAVDLNIYTSVSEIRQNEDGVGKLNHLFQSGEYNNIIDGSINWNGTSFVRQEIYSTIDTLKGALVKVREPTVCKCDVIQAKIVDPNSMLLENLDTAAYFYADSRSIEYVSKKPGNGGTTLTIEFKHQKTKYNGILSYLIRGITWSANYDLFVHDADKSCDLQGYANIRNSQQQEYEVDNTHLYSGDLQLASTSSPIVHLQSVAKAPVANSATVQSNGEEQGFYSYSLNHKYTLRSSSSIRLPFITTSPKCHFYYKATTGIGTGQYKGVFQRTYDLISDLYLPGGILSVRDDQLLIGQANLPDVPKNYTQTITLGQDNDVRYLINGNLTASSGEKANTTWRTYKLEVTISNHKDKNVKGRFILNGGVQTTIKQSTCNSAKVNGNMVHLPFAINANENYQCQVSVTLQWE